MDMPSSIRPRPRRFLASCASCLFILSTTGRAYGDAFSDSDELRRQYLRRSVDAPSMDDYAPQSSSQELDLERRLQALEQQLYAFAGTIEALRNFDTQNDSINSRPLWPGAAQSYYGSTLQNTPRLSRSSSDLDHGRYLVGLDVREVESHQQIIIDYESYSFEGSENNRQPLRIKFEISRGQADLVLSELLETSFHAAANSWSEALKVTPVPDKIYPTAETCGSAIVPSSDRELGIEEADIVIYVSSDNTFCGGATMHSSVCDYDQYMRPLVANINVCTNNVPGVNVTQGQTVEDSTLMEYAGYLTTETGRVLGASTSLMRFYHNPETLSRYGSTEKSLSCVDGTQETMEVPNIIFEGVNKHGNPSYEIRTPKVMEITGNHFDCMGMAGAKLERGIGSTGCFGGFLDDHLFYGEVMSGFELASIGGPAISPLTLAMLEDSSWYEANYEVSTETPFGRGAGCQFAESGCTVERENVNIGSQVSGFHCSEIGELGCDASHSFKAKCDFVDSVLFSSSDFCPMYTREAVSCLDSSDSSDPFAMQGEYYGESSKCFHTDKGHPMCLRGECNTSKQAIDIHYEGKVYSFYHDNQVIVTQMGVQIKCPKIAAVCPSIACPSSCSGKGFCDKDNDGRYSCICDNPYDESPGCYGH